MILGASKSTAETDRNAPALEIRLFGSFDVRGQGHALHRLRTRKGQWLLALPALRHGREVQRDWLAGVLWPDSDEFQILPNPQLQASLAAACRALGQAAFDSTSSKGRTMTVDQAVAYALSVQAVDAGPEVN